MRSARKSHSLFSRCLRTGYLIKPETARAIAATAVNSRSRVAFFESIEYVFLGNKKTEEDRKAREKFMEDRKQIK